jgi:hypothetical protein
LARAPAWSLVLDQEEDLGMSMRPLTPAAAAEDAGIHAAAALPLEEIVKPVGLDRLTVAEAPESYLERIERQRNLPQAIKDGLRRLYGRPLRGAETRPRPEGALERS